MSGGVGHRCGLLWLWHRTAAVALIRPLAWETPYAAGAALKSNKQTKQIINVECWPFHKHSTNMVVIGLTG